MNTITSAAKQYSMDKHGDVEFYNSSKYDGFIAGALAPETEAFYKRKFSHICGEGDYNQDISEFDPHSKAKEEVMNLIRSGNLLQAVKYWKDVNPGMGLKEAKDYIDTLRPKIVL